MPMNKSHACVALGTEVHILLSTWSSMWRPHAHVCVTEGKHHQLSSPFQSSNPVVQVLNLLIQASAFGSLLRWFLCCGWLSFWTTSYLNNPVMCKQNGMQPKSFYLCLIVIMATIFMLSLWVDKTNACHLNDLCHDNYCNSINFVQVVCFS